MKRKLNLHGAIFVLILTAAIGSSCGSSNTDSNNAGALSTPTVQTSPPANAENKAAGPDDKYVVDVGLIDNSVANADTAMIFKVDKEVLLKSKGAADFVRILSGLFRGGDILRVGQQAVAWVTCPDGHVCPLNTGEYTDCCKVTCANPIQLRPPQGDEPRVMMKRMDLPVADRQKFDGAEMRIRQLGADDVTEQFLIANLYSSWKVAEANDEVKKLSEKLMDPAAPEKLKQLYVPIFRKTGDLYFKINQTAAAERTYSKAIELAPAANDEKEKAAAHSSLGQLYETTGKKEAAVENLEKATVLYDKEGDTRKATQIRRVITRVQKQ
jgi:tetratricopeptide (TPR) repeat protein